MAFVFEYVSFLYFPIYTVLFILYNFEELHKKLTSKPLLKLFIQDSIYQKFHSCRENLQKSLKNKKESNIKKKEILELLHTHLQIQVIPRMVAKLQVSRHVFPLLGCVHCHRCLKVKTTTWLLQHYNMCLTVVTANAPPHYCAVFFS